MRFRTPQHPPRFLSRKDRSRLVWLGLGLMLVIVAIKVAADPATWATFFSGAADATTTAPGLSEVSFEVSLLDEEGLEADEFRSEPTPEIAQTTADAPRQNGSGGIEFDEGLFADVSDNTLNLRASEHDAYFAILSRLHDLDLSTIEKAADPSATFATVMLEPDHYRGRPVTIQGAARRILELPAGANPAGIETLYELWVFTPDSDVNPWRVVALDVPADLPRGVFEQGVPVKITGIFFKRQGYETQQHKLHVAPLLLAKTVRRSGTPTRAIVEFDPTPYVLGVGAVVLVGLGILFWRFRREDKAFEKTTLSRFTEATDEAVASIPPTEPDDPDAFFRQMREKELRESNEPGNSQQDQ